MSLTKPVVETDSKLDTLMTMTATGQQQYIEPRKRVKAHIDARWREPGAEKEARTKGAGDMAPDNRTGESYVRSPATPLDQAQAVYDRLVRWLVDEQMGIHKAVAKHGEGVSFTSPRSTVIDPVVREYADRLAMMLVAPQREEAAKQNKSASFLVRELGSRPTQRGTGTDSSALMTLAEVATQQKQHPSQDVRRP